MRRRRVKLVGERAVYHCLSRVAGGAYLFDDEAKTVFREMLWKVADFTGVEILAYCVMSNHFHILLRTPSVEAVEALSRDELEKRYARFYADRSPVGMPTPDEMARLLRDNPRGEGARWEERLRARMGDVSEFMKTLKQRFTVWFNVKHQRFGTLWAERFTSLVVEDSALARQTVAAYIALNPVRAGLVESPKDYQWSSYAEAAKGAKRARQGLVAIEGLESEDAAWRNHAFLLSKLSDPEPDKDESAGTVSAAGRRRELTAGVALGSESFVQRIVAEQRHERRIRRTAFAKEISGFGRRGMFVFGSLREVGLRG